MGAYIGGIIMEEFRVERKGRGDLSPKDPKKGWVASSLEEAYQHCELTREIIKETNDQVHKEEHFEDEHVKERLSEGRIIYTPMILFRGVIGTEVCPLCGSTFKKGMGALSRKDNETVMCSDCGTEEAMSEYLSEKK